jgi:aryl-alcohol dehydrogenase-like predicted oxidoreductase
VADGHGATIAQVSLSWLRAKQAVASVIIGARTMEQLEDNLKAADLALSAEEMAQLDEASALPELYPYRFIDVYGQRA